MNKLNSLKYYVDNLLNKGADELQQEGILPRGASYMLASRLGSMLVVHERQIENLDVMWDDIELVSQLQIARDILPIGAVQVQEIAIANDEGVHTIADVTHVEVTEQVTFNIQHQQSHIIRGASAYSWLEAVIIPRGIFDRANRLEELFLQSEEEQQLLNVLHRFAPDVVLQLNTDDLTPTSKVQKIKVRHVAFELVGDVLRSEQAAIQLSQPASELFEWLVKELQDGVS